MVVEQIFRNGIKDYLELLTPDEIFGIDQERYVAFGAYEEKTGEPFGVITLEILPDYVSLKRIFTAPEYRNRGVATELLTFIRNVPEEEKIPLMVITDEECGFFEKCGFTFEKSECSLAVGRLDGIERTSVGKDVRKNNTIKYLGEVDQDEIEDFVMNSPHDDLIQFPDMAVNRYRFSEGSLVCLTGGKVTGAILMEESEDSVRITWMYALDHEILMLMLSAVKTELEMEYESNQSISFLLCDRYASTVVKKVFHKSGIRPIIVYRSYIGG